MNARGLLAIGDTAQQLTISGSQRFCHYGRCIFTGGVLALPSNIGHFNHNAFSFVPEIGVNVGYQILPCLRGFVGYNFLYSTNVIRPGTSIDRSLDVTQIPNFALNPEPAPWPRQAPGPGFQRNELLGARDHVWSAIHVLTTSPQPPARDRPLLRWGGKSLTTRINFPTLSSCARV